MSSLYLKKDLVSLDFPEQGVTRGQSLGNDYSQLTFNTDASGSYQVYADGTD